jgi:hypothetical protein
VIGSEVARCQNEEDFSISIESFPSGRSYANASVLSDSVENDVVVSVNGLGDEL